jgi:hypothetical protein
MLSELSPGRPRFGLIPQRVRNECLPHFARFWRREPESHGQPGPCSDRPATGALSKPWRTLGDYALSDQISGWV